jgi:hypothetical protein
MHPQAQDGAEAEPFLASLTGPPSSARGAAGGSFAHGGEAGGTANKRIDTNGRFEAAVARIDRSARRIAGELAGAYIAHVAEALVLAVVSLPNGCYATRTQ